MKKYFILRLFDDSCGDMIKYKHVLVPEFSFSNHIPCLVDGILELQSSLSVDCLSKLGSCLSKELDV